jgi:hypothetical protein
MKGCRTGLCKKEEGKCSRKLSNVFFAIEGRKFLGSKRQCKIAMQKRAEKEQEQGKRQCCTIAVPMV